MARSGKVFFLGAGASKSICPALPLASELTLAHLLDKSTYDPQTGAPGATEKLQDFLHQQRNRAEWLSSQVENIFGRLTPRTPPSFPHENLFICVCRRLSIPDDHAVDFNLIRWLEEVRKAGHVIITTNYDSLIEHDLAHYGTGEYALPDRVDRDALHWIDYGVPEGWYVTDFRNWATPAEHSIICLKMHGSLGWVLCLECKRYNLDPLHRFGAEWATLGLSSCSECGRDTRHSPILVPPLAQKDYSEPAIKRIWDRAHEELVKANEIVFVGFSLNPFDHGIQELLKTSHADGAKRRVFIVDPKATDLIPRYREIYGDVVEVSREANWSDYLKNHYPPKYGTRL